MQNNGRHDVAASHGSLQLAEVIRERDIAKLVHHHPHGNGQRPLMHLVRLIVKTLKGAGVEHTHDVVEGAVVVRDDGKHGLLALAHLVQFHIVFCCDVLYLRQDERGQPHRRGDQDALRGLARSLLVNLIFPHGDMAGVILLQRLKQKV